MPAKNPTEASREADIAALAVQLKQLNDSSKREGIARLKKSPNKSDRELAEIWENELATDTSTMIQTREGSGRRIGKDGRPVGEEIPKVEGTYQVQKKAKGGSVRGAGKAQRGVRKCKMVVMKKGGKAC
jgi:hypothetical protein